MWQTLWHLHSTSLTRMPVPTDSPGMEVPFLQRRCG
ncbi:hypothetical protein GBAR_LOCUS25730, partial [Geodia barretti]